MRGEGDAPAHAEQLRSAADKVQRQCKFVMWVGNITGNRVTCGVCTFCRLSERLRS